VLKTDSKDNQYLEATQTAAIRCGSRAIIGRKRSRKSRRKQRYFAVNLIETKSRSIRIAEDKVRIRGELKRNAAKLLLHLRAIQLPLCCRQQRF
jgi:ribosomal protein L28